MSNAYILCKIFKNKWLPNLASKAKHIPDIIEYNVLDLSILFTLCNFYLPIYYQMILKNERQAIPYRQ